MGLILNHKDGLEIDDASLEKYFNAIESLRRMGEGLFWLYDHVKQVEGHARIEAEEDRVLVSLFPKAGRTVSMGRVSLLFQWYAVSACNLAQLVGWLTYRQPSQAQAYVKRVMPRLSDYRNKVAAHVALASPRGDNDADLELSVMTYLIYNNGRLMAGALKPEIESKDGAVTPSRDYGWSLTAAHETLTPRYWPGGRPKAANSLRLPPGPSSFGLELQDPTKDPL